MILTRVWWWTFAVASVLGAATWLVITQAASQPERARRVASQPAPAETVRPEGAALTQGSARAVRTVSTGPAAEPVPDRDSVLEERQLAAAQARVREAPAEVLREIDAAESAHPDSSLAEQWAALRVDAWVFTGEIGRARDAAEEFLERYPTGPTAARIEALTGVHPRVKESP